VRAARCFVADCTTAADVEERDTAVLLVSELVTNAVLHGGPHAPTATIGLAVDVLRDRIRVEVDDAGSNRPVLGDGRPDRPGGRGLMLVQAMASRWGCDPAGVGKTVWFEVDAT
jgi:serine/threonine-protein kinase RsbW